ncbi:hypothetical protein H2198_000023 [Neophaeococcomyces mojaviensis]|uniref:Uncharacterized protein n=1 Tax=Neophaeococcomyces mojaviensis TaxID=3383035 RepID=A0ACC3AKP7_9EURO|nr:hypothetical protein H2198_000023 [Knufia sp. JES_112]
MSLLGNLRYVVDNMDDLRRFENGDKDGLVLKHAKRKAEQWSLRHAGTLEQRGLRIEACILIKLYVHEHGESAGDGGGGNESGKIELMTWMDDTRDYGGTGMMAEMGVVWDYDKGVVVKRGW